MNMNQNTRRSLKKTESESEPDADHINEPIVFRADDADKPISFDDLQAENQSTRVITKPTCFDFSDNENKELICFTQKKSQHITWIVGNTTSQLTKTVYGYDTSTHVY